MAAGIYNMELEQGVTKTIQVTYQDSDEQAIDLTGYQGRGSIRYKATDADVIAEFEVTVTTPLEGKVTIVLDADALTNLTLKGKAYNELTMGVYDIELYKDDNVIRLLNGTVSISPEVTK